MLLSLGTHTSSFSITAPSRPQATWVAAYLAFVQLVFSNRLKSSSNDNKLVHLIHDIIQNKTKFILRFKKKLKFS